MGPRRARSTSRPLWLRGRRPSRRPWEIATGARVTPECSATTADAYWQGSRRMRRGRQDRTACSIARRSAAACGPGKGRLSTRRPHRRGVAGANSAQIAPIGSGGGPSPRLTAIPAAPARLPVDLVITSSGWWPSAWAAAPKRSSRSRCPGPSGGRPGATSLHLSPRSQLSRLRSRPAPGGGRRHARPRASGCAWRG